MLRRLQGNNGRRPAAEKHLLLLKDAMVNLVERNARRRAAGKHLLLLKDALVNLVERNARRVVANGKVDREMAVPAAQYSCRIFLVICGWINLISFLSLAKVLVRN